MKLLNIRTVASAVAAIAFAAPVAQAQTHRPNVSIHLNGSANRGSTVYNGMGSSAGRIYGSRPYLYDTPGYFYPQGVLVLGSNGQIYAAAIDNGILNPAYQNGANIPAPLQFSDKIEAVRLPDNRVRVQWNGDTRPVASIKFSLLNRKRAVLQTAVVTDLPAAATFARTADAAYYRVMVNYSDGAVRSLVATL